GCTLSVLDNQRTFTRSSSAGVLAIITAFNNCGAVSVATGTVQLTGPARRSADYTIASGAVLSVANGHTWGATASATGAGTLQVTSGTVSVAGPWNLTGTTQVTGGSLAYNAASGSTANLDVSGGTITGTGLLTVPG